jgi:membrane protease YdiL (CAAX protease family)
MILLTLFTAGLLRQFHDETPISPFVPPVVGSLLFAAIVFVLLVAAREWRVGAVRGRGVRLGSVTPLLLMLLVEKWTSLAVYNPVFYAISPRQATYSELNRYYVAFAGAGLVLVSVLLAQFSRPAGRRTWGLVRPARWPAAAAAAALVVLGSYSLLGGLAVVLGGGLQLRWAQANALLYWDVGGQAVLAFSEELYYRGLLLSEIQRLSPRLGLRSPLAGRWLALLATSTLFSMEHLRLGPPLVVVAQQLAFTFSLAMLFGILVLVTSNVHFAAGIHAWINWLLLGAAPRFVDGSGQSALPAGTYIGVTLILAFVLAFALKRRYLARRASLADSTSA